MSTLMVVYRGSKRLSQCDARCYDGNGRACSCCCGGANHGVGLKEAIRNTLLRSKAYAEFYAVEQGYEPWETRLVLPLSRTRMTALLGV